MPTTIRIPIPQKNPPFMRRHRGVGAFLAPSSVPSTKGIGAFFAQQPNTAILPAISIFNGGVRRAGLGSFTAPASYPLPGPNLFTQYASRGLGRLVRRGRRFPRRGLGQDDGAPTVADLVAVGVPEAEAENMVINYTTGSDLPVGWDSGTTPAVTPVTVPVAATSQPASTTPSDNAAVVQGYQNALNIAIQNAQARGVVFTSTQLSALQSAAATATSDQLISLISQVNALTAAGSTSSLTTSLTNWFNGSTTLFGSVWKNQTLVLGGAAGVLGLALVSSMGGSKKRRR